MTRFVVTAGFKAQKIIQPVIGYGVSSQDIVQLLVPAEDDPPDPRQQAIDDASETLRMVSGEDLTVEEVEINCADFVTTLFDCLQVLRPEGDGDIPVVCLAGGVTDLALPLTLSTATLWPLEIEALQYYSELQSTGADCVFPNLLSSLPGRAADTYDAILTQTDYGSVDTDLLTMDLDQFTRLPVLGDRKDEMPPPEVRVTTFEAITESTEQSAATVSRHTDALVDADFVSVYTDPERNEICPTASGLLLVM